MNNSNDRNTNRSARAQEDKMGAQDQLNTDQQPTGSARDTSEEDTNSSARDES